LERQIDSHQCAISTALTATAQGLGTFGKDIYYGYGLVQAKAVVAYLVGSGGTTTSVHIADLDATKSLAKNNWTATVTAKVTDQNEAAVAGTVVART